MRRRERERGKERRNKFLCRTRAASPRARHTDKRAHKSREPMHHRDRLAGLLTRNGRVYTSLDVTGIRTGCYLNFSILSSNRIITREILIGIDR